MQAALHDAAQPEFIAGHGGTAALLYGAPAITGHGEASRGAHKIRRDLVMLFLLPKPDERLR